jgi:hypothetical protein
MSLYTVQRAIFRMKKDKPFVKAFLDDPDAALATAGLTDQEQAALRDGDLAALYRMGVHPLLLAPYSRIMGIPRPRYQELLAPLAGQRRMQS